MADLLVDGGALLASVVHGGAGLGVLGPALLLVLRGLGGRGHGAALPVRHSPALLLGDGLALLHGLLLVDGLLYLLAHLLLHLLAHLRGHLLLAGHLHIATLDGRNLVAIGFGSRACR